LLNKDRIGAVVDAIRSIETAISKPPINRT
jgi:hypothetical protein